MLGVFKHGGNVFLSIDAEELSPRSACLPLDIAVCW